MQSLNNQQGTSLSVVVLPVWVRVAIVELVAILFLTSLTMLMMSILDPGLAHWAQPAADIGSVAATGFLVLLVMFFLQRSRSLKAIDELTEDFLLREVPRALSALSEEEPSYVPWHATMRARSAVETRADIRIAYSKGAYRARYIIKIGGRPLRVKVEFNVRRLGVVFTLPAEEHETATSVFAGLKDTLGGAQSAGYSINETYEVTELSQQMKRELQCTRCVSHTLHRNLESDFIYDEAQRLFVAQDLAIMTRSLMSERGLAPFGA